jgi:hypothetical protein
VDTLNEKYPELSAYQYASNRPITMIDLDGLEGVLVLENTYNKNDKIKKIGKATLIQNYYYTTNPDVKGHVTEEQIKYMKGNINSNYADLENTIKHGYLKTDDKKYKFQSQINFVNTDVTAERQLIETAFNDEFEGHRIGNMIGVNYWIDEQDLYYGGATDTRIDVMFERMMGDYPLHTDANTPIHEALHNIGGASDHTDGGMNSYTGTVNLQYQSFDGTTGVATVKAPVRRMEMDTMQRIVDRALNGENKRLKIIDRTK